MAELIAFIPTLCALSLVVFGLGGYQPTAPVVLWTIAGAIMGGPVPWTCSGSRVARPGRCRYVGLHRVRRRSAAPRAHPYSVINEPAVTEYLTGLEPEPDPLLAEMRAHGERDHIPIVEHVTGGLLEVLAASNRRKARGRGRHRDRRVDAPPRARGRARDVVRGRPRAARGGEGVPPRATRRAGDLRLQDATEGLGRAGVRLFDLAFIDGPKAGYATHLDEAVRLVGKGGLVLVDNVLMGGGAATGQPTNQWGHGDRST